MKKLHRQRIVSVLVIAELALNSFGSTLLISPVYAQEASSSTTPSAIPTEATSSAKQNPDLLTQASSAATSLLPNVKTETVQGTSSPAKEITSQTTSTSKTPSLWTAQNGAYTTEILRLGVTYRFPPNEKVSLTFTKLPEGSGTVTVKEHEVPQSVGNAGSRDYEITSTMPNGTFSFDLTLPTQDPTKKVLSSNDGQNYDVVSNETVVSSDVVTIKGITHLTHFVIGDETANYNHVVINEFFPDGSNEWVEMYNPTNQEQNITGWSIEDNDPDLGSPFTFPEGSTIPAKGFLAVDITVTLNDGGDTVNFISGDGTLFDSHTYSSDPGSSSIGRIVDGGPTFTTFATPTRGVSNGATLNTLYVNSSWDSPDNDGGHSWGFDAFNNISSAIDFAPAGSTINVSAGTYEESITIAKSLTLSGVGSGTTTIDGCEDVITITASSVTVKGFTLTDSNCGGGSIVYIGSSIQGINIEGNIIQDGENGIYANGSTNTTFQNNEIRNNTYGVYLTGDISGSQIKNNNIHDNGEGVSASGASFSELSISGNQITNSNDGYGIYFNAISGSVLTISQNQITGGYDNGIYLSGGGAQISNSTVNISGNTVSSNGSDGIYADVIVNSTLNVSNNTVGTNDGNGIYLCAAGQCNNNSILRIKGNSISGNGNSGISLYEIFSSTVTIGGEAQGDRNTITNNGSSGIYIQYIGTPQDPSNVAILNNTISSNSEQGIYLANFDSTSTVSANQNNILGNNVGVQNNDLQDFFYATLNFWGDASGPLDANLNPNGLGNSVAGRVLFSPFYTDSARTTLTEIEFNAGNINLANFDDWGIFDLSEDGEDLVRFVDLLQQFEFEAVEDGGENDVVLPEGVRIERSDDLEFDWDSLSLQDVAESLMSGFDSTTAIVDAIQWGIPGVELEFSTPITVRIFVGTDLNGQTLNVVRSTSGSGGWTSSGIVAPATCVVTGGICTFQATLASYFASARSITTSQTSSSSTNQPAAATSTNTSVTQFSTAACNDPKPAIPALNTVSIDNATAKLSWTRPNAPVSYYQILFGPASNSAQHQIPYTGNPDQTTYQINDLSQGVTYYFKVRAVNGCTHGDYSNELSATPQIVILATSLALPISTLQKLASVVSPVVLGSTTTQPSVPEEKIQPVGETSKELAKNILGEKAEKEPPIKPTPSVGSQRDIFVALALVMLLSIGIWFIRRGKVG